MKFRTVLQELAMQVRMRDTRDSTTGTGQLLIRHANEMTIPLMEGWLEKYGDIPLDQLPIEELKKYAMIPSIGDERAYYEKIKHTKSNRA